MSLPKLVITLKMITPTKLIRPKYLDRIYYEIIAPDEHTDKASVSVTMSNDGWLIHFDKLMNQPMLLAYYVEKIVDVVLSRVFNEEQTYEFISHYQMLAIGLFRSLTTVYQQAAKNEKVSMSSMGIDWIKVVPPCIMDPESRQFQLTNMALICLNFSSSERDEAANDI